MAGEVAHFVGQYLQTMSPSTYSCPTFRHKTFFGELGYSHITAARLAIHGEIICNIMTLLGIFILHLKRFSFPSLYTISHTAGSHFFSYDKRGL